MLFILILNKFSSTIFSYFSHVLLTRYGQIKKCLCKKNHVELIKEYISMCFLHAPIQYDPYIL